MDDVLKYVVEFLSSQINNNFLFNLFNFLLIISLFIFVLIKI